MFTCEAILVKDKKKKKQNEGLQSPAEKTPEEKDISPEINKIAASSSLRYLLYLLIVVGLET